LPDDYDEEIDIKEDMDEDVAINNKIKVK